MGKLSRVWLPQNQGKKIYRIRHTYLDNWLTTFNDRFSKDINKHVSNSKRKYVNKTLDEINTKNFNFNIFWILQERLLRIISVLVDL